MRIRRRFRTGAAIAMIAASTIGCRRHAAHGAPVAPSLPKTQAFEHVRALVEEVGPRLAGSENDAKAVAWAQARMESLGFAHVHAEAVQVPHWVRGNEAASIVAPISMPLAITALGGSVGTPPEGVDAEVIEAADLDAIDKLPDDAVKGKIVFLSKAMRKTKTGEGYGEAVGGRARGASRAAKKGAIAFLIRSVSTSEARTPHTGALSYAADSPKIPAASIAVPDAELLHRELARGPVVVHLFLGAETFPDSGSANVIGEVVGREKPDEIVVVGAHLDSWDLAEGALDDGAGVAVTLEVGKRLLSRPPKRTVRLVLFACEETGIKGAFAYAAAHHDELPKHVAAMETDNGADRVWALAYQAGDGAKEFLAPAMSALRPYGVMASLEGHAAFGDVEPMASAGVPAVHLAQDATRYFDHHHSADDTLDKIDPAALDQVTLATEALVRVIADVDGRLGPIPEEKRPKGR